MPLIVITGIPSSGKSSRMSEIKKHFESIDKPVHVISENEVLKSSGQDKNELFANSAREKQMRSLLKSEAQRLLQKENVVILDAGNYIKGYRYELYCMSKASKCTQCTVHCQVPIDTAREWNSTRKEEQYSPEIFDALVNRYEAPNSNNRWDSPLFTLLPEDSLEGNMIYSALFERAAPPPNQSTQNPPLSSTDYLYEVDRVTQDIVSAILNAQKIGIQGEIRIPGYKDCVFLETGSVTASDLARRKRNFLGYLKLNPCNDVAQIPKLFIQYLTTSMK